MFGTFGTLVLVQYYDLQVWEISMLLLASSVVNFLIAPLLGRLLDGWGERATLSTSYVLLALCFVGYAVLHNVWMLGVCLIGINLLVTLSIGLLDLCEPNRTARRTHADFVGGRKHQSHYLGRHVVAGRHAARTGGLRSPVLGRRRDHHVVCAVRAGDQGCAGTSPNAFSLAGRVALGGAQIAADGHHPATSSLAHSEFGCSGQNIEVSQ